MKITDLSGQSSIGMAMLNRYKDKLTPLRQINLMIWEGQQFLVVTGPKTTLASNSFSWGKVDEWTRTLSQATTVLGWPVPPEVLQQIPATEERIIHTSRSYQGPRQRL